MINSFIYDLVDVKSNDFYTGMKLVEWIRLDNVICWIVCARHLRGRRRRGAACVCDLIYVCFVSASAVLSHE